MTGTTQALSTHIINQGSTCISCIVVHLPYFILLHSAAAPAVLLKGLVRVLEGQRSRKKIRVKFERNQLTPMLQPLHGSYTELYLKY